MKNIYLTFFIILLSLSISKYTLATNDDDIYKKIETEKFILPTEEEFVDKTESDNEKTESDLEKFLKDKIKHKFYEIKDFLKKKNCDVHIID